MVKANAGRPVRQHHYQKPDFGCSILDCEDVVTDGAPIDLCERHMRLAFAWVMSNAETLSASADYHPPAPAVRPPRFTVDTPGHVYFIKKDDLIKIGWSSQVEIRLRSWQPCTVLLVQPGTIRDERRCHAAFSHLLAKGEEWFTPAPDLYAFIESLGDQAA